MSLSQSVYERLRALIADGTFVAGARLPTEAEIAARFGVSRPVVRKALAMLREEGLIASRQGAGSFVRSHPEARAAPVLVRPIANISDVTRFFEFRAPLERAAAQYAARRRRAEDIADLRANLGTIAAAARGDRDAGAADIAFHLALARACGNQFFEDTLKLMRPQLEQLMRLSASLDPRPPMVRAPIVEAEHAAIVAAIEAGDPAAAGEAAHRHIANSMRRVFGTELDALLPAGLPDTVAADSV